MARTDRRSAPVGRSKIVNASYSWRWRIVLVGTLWLMLAITSQPVWAHEGHGRTLQQVQVPAGAYQLTIWTTPARLRPGEIHVETLVTDQRGQVDETCAVQIALLSLEQPQLTLQSLSLPNGAGLRTAAFDVVQPGRYLVEARVLDETGVGGRTSFAIEVVPASALVQGGIYLVLGASLVVALWMLKQGVALWAGQTASGKA
jgi:hypothetical protein